MSEEELEEAMAQIDAKRGNSRHKRILANCISIIRSVREFLRDDGNINCDVMKIRQMIESRLGFSQRGLKGEFVEWFEKAIESKRTPGTKSVYKQTLDKLREYDKAHNIDLDNLKFSNINFSWLEDFESFCAQTATKNARNIHLRNIRAVFNYALDHDVETPYPFRRFKIRPEETRKRALTVEQVRELFTCPVEPYAEIYRDLFKLIFMLCGINTVDLYNLTDITNGRIEYRRAKTHRLYSIKVEPEAMEIIEKYKGEKNLLMLADRWGDDKNFRRQMNKALKAIGVEKNKGGRLKGGEPNKTDKDNKKRGEWSEISSYWARHSWATIAYSIGISKDIISQALGHSDGHDTTNIYIKEDDAKVDEANRKVLDYVLYGGD